MAFVDRDPLTHYEIRRAEWERTVERMLLVKEARGLRRPSSQRHTSGLLMRITAALAARRRMIAARLAIVPRPYRDERECVDC